MKWERHQLKLCHDSNLRSASGNLQSEGAQLQLIRLVPLHHSRVITPKRVSGDSSYYRDAYTVRRAQQRSRLGCEIRLERRVNACKGNSTGGVFSM
jgi:hypothetical protein